MRRRRRAIVLAVLPRVLTCAICAISLLGLVSIHLHVLPNLSRVPMFDESISLPTATQQQENKHHRLSTQQSWTQELPPPHFSQAPAPPIVNQEYQSTSVGHTENRLTLELASTHLSKALVSSPKLNGTSRVTNFGKLWKRLSNSNFLPCVEPSPNYTSPVESRGYILVHTNGGLNQMRAGICDMVAIARIINATLVVPELDKRSFWQDNSNFSDIFDEDRFINALSNDVKVAKKLPKDLSGATTVVKHFKSYSGLDYYQGEIGSMWEEYKVIRAAKSDSRLVNNNLPPDIQKLRCRACYEALRFSPKIEETGKLLVDRMRSYGPYIALHLRFEKDMLAFSGCTHGLSPSEIDELRTIRENTAYWKVKDIDGMEQRSKGHCPLTPKEVGMFLSALGYPSDTPIYIAAGEIYGGESRMADLRSRFSMLLSKEKLASLEELEPFINHASQMAALDYIVSVESDVFIPSYSGNMARAVEGHRRYLGHRKTIAPDRKALVRLFDKVELGALKEGTKVSNRIIEIHKTRQGKPRRRKGPISGTKGMDRFRSEEPFYENPLPDCLCQRGSLNRNTSATTR